MRNLMIAMTIAFAALAVAGCEKEKNDTAPVPPAAQTLALDLSSFQSTVSKSGTDNSPFNHFKFVATQVVNNWVTVFNQVINVPVEAYRQLTISAIPVENDHGWTWTVDYVDGYKQEYTVALYGVDKGDIYEWEVHVSKDGILGYEDFTWITGWSAKDGSHGRWDIRVSPLDTDILVNIEWAASEEKVETVKVTYELDHLCHGIDPFFNSSYIIYSASATDPAYDRSITAYYEQMHLGFWKVDIEWNMANGSGRVCSQNKYGDTLWHCWDTTHENTEQ